jgi:hypothetical protein
MSTPVPVTEAPGNYLTAALWNATVTATMQRLFVDGPPRFLGYSSAGTTMASSTTFTPILLDVEVYDSWGGHSLVTNTSRYVVQAAGTYLITATACFAANSTGNRAVQVGINGGSGAPGMRFVGPNTGANSWFGTVTVQLPLNVGDYVECMAWQTSGGALTVPTGSPVSFPSLSLLWLSP